MPKKRSIECSGNISPKHWQSLVLKGFIHLAIMSLYSQSSAKGVHLRYNFQKFQTNQQNQTRMPIITLNVFTSYWTTGRMHTHKPWLNGIKIGWYEHIPLNRMHLFAMLSSGDFLLCNIFPHSTAFFPTCTHLPFLPQISWILIGSINKLTHCRKH